ncbi:MAG: hypothetical protein QOI36_3004 [Pseudonocardiales bacterium]|nr:hypothetical protein [Pseudonocardiales bacterium]
MDLRLTLDNLLVITVVAVIAPDAPAEHGHARSATLTGDAEPGCARVDAHPVPRGAHPLPRPVIAGRSRVNRADGR